ncbi:probable rRNA-processing protein EBP2 homolog [Chironomus tepperi]|uniref:probable rRNA-processing protein EBP2 homolog n=1 Tax=Chironomus tepperi TaxID=113505 RepID=UPI00391F7498
MAKFVEESYDEESYDEENSSDEELREAFKKGLIKPGLNVQIEPEKTFANNIPKMKEKLDEMILELPWVERLDMTNDLAPVAPELAIQIERHEQKRENQFKGNKKIPYVEPENDPVLNDFKREIIFYRQAQTAIKDGIKKLIECGIPTKRPDDYFAEMAKTDEHMQKIRKHLVAKQEGKQRSERVRQLREQKKMAKAVQREAEEKKQANKTKMLKDLKAYRKGKLKNLDFLDDDKKKQRSGPKKPAKKRQERDKKFGFGGKKRGSKRNTKEGAGDVRDFSSKRNREGVGSKAFKNKGNKNKNGKNKNQRLGKSRRVNNRK